MICSLALLGIAFAVPSNLISIEIAPCSLKAALEKLSPQLDRTWMADEKMGEEIICIRTRNMDQAELQKHIATATGGIWVNQQGKDILTLPAWLDKQQEEEVIRERAKLILKAQSERPELKTLARGEVEAWLGQLELTVRNMREAYPHDYVSFDRARQQHFDLLRKGPVTRLLERIVAKMDIQSLARLEPSQQVCYSDSPNRMERPLGFDVAPLLRQFADEQNLVRSVLPTGKEFDFGFEDRRAWTLGADPDVARILVVVTMRRGLNLPSINLRLLNREGWVTASIGFQLTTKNEPSATSIQPNARLLSITPKIREWGRVLTWMTTDMNKDSDTKKTTRSLIEPWLPTLLRPETYDPLSMSVGDVLADYGKVKSKNVIASLSDRAITWRAPNMGDLAVPEFERACSELWKLERSEGTGTVVFRPKLYWEQRSERIKREALGKFFRQINSAGGVLVEHSAEYLWSSNSKLAFEFFNYDSYGRGLGEKVQGSYEAKALTSWYQRAPLKFVGSISEKQRRDLFAGGEITVAQLSSLAKAELQRMFYSQDSIDDLFKSFVRNGTVRDYLGHATDLVWEKLPNGIPATTRIICKRTIEPAIIRSEGDDALLTCHTPEWLGERLVNEEGQADEQKTQPLLLGSANCYQFKFVFPNSIEASITLSEIVPGKRRQLKDYTELPANIRARVEKSMAAELKRLEEAKKANQGTSPPPP